jgi:hypothetical protein
MKTAGEVADDYANANGKAPTTTLRCLTTEEMEALPQTDYLVSGLLVKGTLASLIGRWGLGKTFAGIDLAMCIGTGSNFHSMDTTAGTVLYVIAEGVGSIQHRTRAWRTAYGHEGQRDAVYWVPGGINLYNPAACAALTAKAIEVCAVLVIIDTLARCTPGADIDGAKDAGIVVHHLEQLIDATGATVLLVHRPGKDASKGGRGSSAFVGAVDTELELTGDGDQITLTVQKQKDGPDGQQWKFHRTPVGESCVLIDAVETVDDLPLNALGLLDTLRAIYFDGGRGTTPWTTSAEIPESTFYKYRTLLISHGVVRNIGTARQPRYQPIHKDGTWPTE